MLSPKHQLIILMNLVYSKYDFVLFCVFVCLFVCLFFFISVSTFFDLKIMVHTSLQNSLMVSII